MRVHPLLRSLLASLFAMLASSGLQAAPLKMGTIVPVGTSYHKILMGMGESWKRDSGGSVELKIFAGGKLGGEAEMVGLMMQNNLQAAVLTAVGLSEIESAVTAVQNIPMAFRDLDEMDSVLEHLRPMLEQRLLAKGFVVLFWSDGGWIRFFAKKPAAHPDEMKKLKLFVWSGNITQAEIAKQNGFNPVSIETADIVPALQTGLIEAVPLPSFYALAGQVDKLAPFMLDLNYAPLVGACIVRKDTWEKIAPDLRAKLLAEAATAGLAMKTASRRESVESVVAMQKRGLKVLHLTKEQVDAWQSVCESLYPPMRGRMVPVDVFEETLRLVAEYRREHAAAAPSP